jgi:hypothetical protein
VKYSYDSEKLDYLSNHSMCVVTDGYNYERVIIFGGIKNDVVPELQSEEPE